MERIDPESLDLDELEHDIKDHLDKADYDTKLQKFTPIPPNVAIALVKRCKGSEAALQEAGEALQRHLDEQD